MSDKQKYYTPALEDIKLGLSCELWNVNKKEFVPSTLLNAQIIWVLLSKGVLHDHIRVPYLTAEQIEAEGWKITKSDDLSVIFTNWASVFHYGYDGHYLTAFRSDPEDTIFMGKCRCKNDLRLICKMLGI